MKNFITYFFMFWFNFCNGINIDTFDIDCHDIEPSYFIKNINQRYNTKFNASDVDSSILESYRVFYISGTPYIFNIKYIPDTPGNEAEALSWKLEGFLTKKTGTVRNELNEYQLEKCIEHQNISEFIFYNEGVPISIFLGKNSVAMVSDLHHELTVGSKLQHHRSNPPTDEFFQSIRDHLNNIKLPNHNRKVKYSQFGDLIYEIQRNYESGLFGYVVFPRFDEKLPFKLYDTIFSYTGFCIKDDSTKNISFNTPFRIEEMTVPFFSRPTIYITSSKLDYVRKGLLTSNSTILLDNPQILKDKTRSFFVNHMSDNQIILGHELKHHYQTNGKEEQPTLKSNFIDTFSEFCIEFPISFFTDFPEKLKIGSTYSQSQSREYPINQHQLTMTYMEMFKEIKVNGRIKFPDKDGFYSIVLVIAEHSLTSNSISYQTLLLDTNFHDIDFYRTPRHNFSTFSGFKDFMYYKTSLSDEAKKNSTNIIIHDTKNLIHLHGKNAFVFSCIYPKEEEDTCKALGYITEEDKDSHMYNINTALT